MAKAFKYLVPDVLPEWFRLMAPDGKINSRDIAKLFNFSKESVHTLVKDGSFPKPDTTMRKGGAMHNMIINYSLWKVSTIKAEIARRRKHNREVDERKAAVA